MTESLQPEMPGGEELQLDNAEYTAEAPGGLTCTLCTKAIPDTYFEVNGKTLCTSCREALGRELEGGISPGRFARAVFFGTLAALAGGAIWFVVAQVTGSEWGIVSILVGLMVGGAVRAGSRHRGGFIYQALAVFLTYMGIVVCYTAIGLASLFSPEFKAFQEAQEQKKVPVAKAPEAAPPAVEEGKGDNKPEKAPVVVAKDEADAAEADVDDEPDAAEKPVGLLIAGLVVFLVAAPIASNFQSPIGLLIIGFALWEAWKLNKRVKIEINGPYDAGGHDAPPSRELGSHA